MRIFEFLSVGAAVAVTGAVPIAPGLQATSVMPGPGYANVRTSGPPGDTTAPAAPVRVVATLPVYAGIVREIGEEEVNVSAIASPTQDAHFVRPRPSFALDIRQADLLISTGLDLELWLPALLNKAGNPAVVPGSAGFVAASDGIELLDVPENASRREGDVHIYGNPHIYTDPLNVIQIARNITAGLTRVAPERANHFQRGLNAFTERIHKALFGDALVEMLTGATLERLAREGRLFSFLESTPYEGRPLLEYLDGWFAVAEPFRGDDVVCYHKNWSYFENRFGVTCTAFVESKPGIPPTPGHVAELIDLMRNRGVGVIIAANYFDESKVRTVADRAGARPVIVPMQPGGAPGVDSYFAVVDEWLRALARAFRPTS